jgi:hypothetical protein
MIFSICQGRGVVAVRGLAIGRRGLEAALHSLAVRLPGARRRSFCAIAHRAVMALAATDRVLCRRDRVMAIWPEAAIGRANYLRGRAMADLDQVMAAASAQVIGQGTAVIGRATEIVQVTAIGLVMATDLVMEIVRGAPATTALVMATVRVALATIDLETVTDRTDPAMAITALVVLAMAIGLTTTCLAGSTIGANGTIFVTTIGTISITTGAIVG